MKAIEVSNFVKRYGNLTAVDNISFSVEEGSICAILGPNGSGKTTTIKSICNLLKIDSGEIKIYGKSNRKSLKNISALFEGTRNLYWRLTPRENLRYFAGVRGLGGRRINEKIDELLKSFNLWDKKDTMVNELSRGMQQKTAIAMTLVCDTDIVLLDEPTLGLDVESSIEIKRILENIAGNMKKTVLLSTHDMNLVEDVCTDAVILNKGKIVAKDSVHNLIDMVRSKTYEFVLTEPVTKEKKDEILSFGYEFYFSDNPLILEIDITNVDMIYDIINKLRDNNIFISEAKQKEINFERLYLSLIREGMK